MVVRRPLGKARRVVKRRGARQERGDGEGSTPLDKRLSVNLERIGSLAGGSDDFVVREFELGAGSGTRAALVYVDGLADKALLAEGIMRSLTLDARVAGIRFDKKNALRLARDAAISIAEVDEAGTLEAFLDPVLSGEAGVLVDGADRALVTGTRGWKDRGVESPAGEPVIRGPREGFSETLRTNTALLRRRVKSPHLKMERTKVGRVTKTDVVVTYIHGIVAPRLVGEVKRRLSRVDTDAVLESGYVEDFIEDEPASPFPQILVTERPDVAASKLLEGRVVVLTDGTPFALVVPTMLVEHMHSPEDYYSRPFIGNALRLLRLLVVLVALTLPSLYVALTTFHQEMIPTSFLITIAAAREGVPFPAFVEALLLETAFEILREASVRLPRPVGQAVSIVGVLVIGQAAVAAGIVSAPMIIVVAVTGIASFAIPSFPLAITLRFLRFGLLALAAALGLFGLLWGLLAILIHLASLRSFGVPVLAPFAPVTASQLKDAITVAPAWAMRTRPELVTGGPSVRQAPRIGPRKPGGSAEGRGANGA